MLSAWVSLKFQEEVICWLMRIENYRLASFKGSGVISIYTPFTSPAIGSKISTLSYHTHTVEIKPYNQVFLNHIKYTHDCIDTSQVATTTHGSIADETTKAACCMYKFPIRTGDNPTLNTSYLYMYPNISLACAHTRVHTQYGLRQQKQIPIPPLYMRTKHTPQYS